MVLGLGIPEIVLIIIVVGIFFFGAPKVKEWVETFKEKKKEAKEITKE